MPCHLSGDWSTPVESVLLSTFKWVSGFELRQPGFESECLQQVIHFVNSQFVIVYGPMFNLSKFYLFIFSF